MNARLTATARHFNAADPSDEQCIRSVLSGDQGAFSVLYHRHAQRMYRLLTRLIGPVSEREDLLQQLFVDAYRALPSFRGDAAFSTLLYRIAVRLSHDHLTRNRWRRLIAREAYELEDMVSPLASPVERAVQLQQLAQGFRALARLSPKRRVAFTLVVLEELSLREAAEQLGASEDAVKQRVLQARRQLGGTLERLEAQS